MARAYYHVGGATATPVSSSFRHSRHPAYSYSSSLALHATTNITPLTMSDLPTPHPSLEVIGGARDSFLPAFKTLHRPYDPYPFIAWNRHVETIFAAFFRSLPDVRFRRECLRTKDDGSVALDWVSGDHTRLPPHAPVLILLVRLIQINSLSMSIKLLIERTVAARSDWRESGHVREAYAGESKEQRMEGCGVQ